MSIEIRTSGQDPDPDGYILTLDDGPPVSVGAEATVELGKIRKGAHRATLTDIASWCEAPGGTVRDFDFDDAGPQQLVLEVNCRTTFRDWLLYDGWGQIELHDLSGDPRQRGRLGYTSIECNSYCTSIAVSPTGDRAAWITSQSIELMNADGSGRRRLRDTGAAALGTLAWSPDGQRLAYVDQADEVGVREDIFIIKVDAAEQPVQITFVGDAEGLSWSPDGATLVFSRWEYHLGLARLWLVDADGQNLRLLGAQGAQQRSPAWSPDGQSVAYVDGDFVRIVDGDGSNDRVVGPDVAIDPAWSPDGQRIAFAQYDPQGCVYAIMTMNPEGGNVLPVGPTIDICSPEGHQPARHPAWGDDGT